MTQPETIALARLSGRQPGKSVFVASYIRFLQKRGYARLVRTFDGVTVYELTPAGQAAKVEDFI